MPKCFTLAEAESLIPRVDRLVREVVALKAAHDEADGAIRAVLRRVMLMGGMIMDRENVRQNRRCLATSATRLGCILEEIQDLGCIVKDLDAGLVDFPTMLGGAEVCLCWKLGEPAIQFWHGVDEGFAGRKPIDQHFRDHHCGDPLQ